MRLSRWLTANLMLLVQWRGERVIDSGLVVVQGALVSLQMPCMQERGGGDFDGDKPEPTAHV